MSVPPAVFCKCLFDGIDPCDYNFVCSWICKFFIKFVCKLFIEFTYYACCIKKEAYKIARLEKLSALAEPLSPSFGEEE